MCYSAVGSDARVTSQIRWLESAGYTVDVLSRGPSHPDATGDRFEIGSLQSRWQLIFAALMPPRIRFNLTVKKFLPTKELEGRKYDLVVVNDHHLLPWVVRAVPELARGPVVLDLHELYANNGTDLVYRFIVAPYDDWLLRFIKSPVFTRHLTVAEGIADIYRDEYGLERPSVIKNVAPFEDLEPSSVDPKNIRLVHHGYASAERGIDVMLDASLLLDSRFKLFLMVLGDERSLAPLKSHPAIASGRAEFREPVGVTEVAKALNQYDLELIFFPPRFPNNIHALPNKFFEAIQGRLGVIIGESPEIVPFIEEYKFGTIVHGWTASDLAGALNKLKVGDINQMKFAAAKAARKLSTIGERELFLSALGIKKGQALKF